MSRATGGCQPNGAVQSPARVTATVLTTRMPTVVSVAAMRRVKISRKAPASAAPSGSSAAQYSTPPVGRNITRTPAKPASTADQRRQPTRSPSIGLASAVRTSGPAIENALASASGSRLSPPMNRNDEHITIAARAAWPRKLHTRSAWKPPACQVRSAIGRKTKTPRRNSTWPSG